MHSQGWSPPPWPLDGDRLGTAAVWAPVRGLCFSKVGLLTLWGVPSPPSLSSETAKEGKVPPWAHSSSPLAFSSHCDSALLPTETQCGLGAP